MYSLYFLHNYSTIGVLHFDVLKSSLLSLRLLGDLCVIISSDGRECARPSFSASTDCSLDSGANARISTATCEPSVGIATLDPDG